MVYDLPFTISQLTLEALQWWRTMDLPPIPLQVSNDLLRRQAEAKEAFVA